MPVYRERPLFGWQHDIGQIFPILDKTCLELLERTLSLYSVLRLLFGSLSIVSLFCFALSSFSRHFSSTSSSNILYDIRVTKCWSYFHNLQREAVYPNFEQKACACPIDQIDDVTLRNIVVGDGRKNEICTLLLEGTARKKWLWTIKFDEELLPRGGAKAKDREIRYEFYFSFLHIPPLVMVMN